jgi:hypothetical protein
MSMAGSLGYISRLSDRDKKQNGPVQRDNTVNTVIISLKSNSTTFPGPLSALRHLQALPPEPSELCVEDLADPLQPRQNC